MARNLGMSKATLYRGGSGRSRNRRSEAVWPRGGDAYAARVRASLASGSKGARVRGVVGRCIVVVSVASLNRLIARGWAQ
ncbi:hypothetical protein [Kocuria oceani]|uniref:Transposase n=1 Tax=Kocuria oceani TaxID=988827 RepID=A0ABV9TKY7_9MICC